MMTYWLYYGTRVLTAVRLPAGAADADVRMAAVQWHDRVPLCYPDFAPFEWRLMLQRADVVRD